MKSLYQLLEDKNYWYKKYLSSNEAFLQALRHAPEVALEELELFYGNRESLLKILENLDDKMQEQLTGMERTGEFSSEERTKVQHYMREKDSLLRKILELDEEILTTMESLRVEGMNKLKLLAKGKKALAKYKSASNYNDKIDRRI